MAREFFSGDSLSGIFALVVDTDKDRRNLVAGILRYCGALVTPVETPQAALTIMQLLRPDVLVVDVSEPDDGAFELVRAVRALPAEDGGTVSTIAIGGDGTSADRARTCGFDDHVAKPIDPWRLCQLVSELLTR